MKRALNSLVAVVVVLLLGGACDGALLHEVEGGPLGGSARTAGSLGIQPPASYRAAAGTTWHAVDGDTLLCSTSGKPLVIDSIDYDMGLGSPRAVEARMRSLRKETRGSGSRKPIGMLIGTIGHLEWNDSKLPLAGALSGVQGFVVSEPCTEAGTWDEFDELMIQIDAGPRGTWLRSFTIHYHVGHAHYRERVHWSFALMGTGIRALCGHEDNPFHEDDRVCPKTGR